MDTIHVDIPYTSIYIYTYILTYLYENTVAYRYRETGRRPLDIECRIRIITNIHIDDMRVLGGFSVEQIYRRDGTP